MNKRISRSEALQLFKEEDLLSLGRQAHHIRLTKSSENQVTFVIDRNINYSNICVCQCRFCAYYREETDPEGYVLDRETLHQKIAETVDLGGTQILLQGGLHPHLTIDYYEDLLTDIKKNFPSIHIHGFSAPEIWHFSQQSNLTLEETISRLKEAGLGSIPGGGAEILDNRVRSHISPNKIGWEQWMQVMEYAHRQKLRSTATMMFGTVETPGELVDHLLRVRELQDKTGGFTAFIPWSFQPENTDLHNEVPIAATGVDYLRVLALSRIVLDNIDNIQASWVTQGAKMAQVALYFGANDFGSTMIEENVVAAAGVHFRMTLEEMVSTIKEAGFTPAQRNTLYKIIKKYD
ncbi:MAG: dehypoxanthine futalosine cyclase [Xanthomonadaceae bacterium]|nr:dehypoxanthine futalosine cyclase [Xanthomonadaceae bacterium]